MSSEKRRVLLRGELKRKRLLTSSLKETRSKRYIVKRGNKCRKDGKQVRTVFGGGRSCFQACMDSADRNLGEKGTWKVWEERGKGRRAKDGVFSEGRRDGWRKRIGTGEEGISSLVSPGGNAGGVERKHATRRSEKTSPSIPKAVGPSFTTPLPHRLRALANKTQKKG